MKKYVYSKGDEKVTVETDGLGTINNFMITGLIGKNYGSIVAAGLDFNMGQSVTIAEMVNAAKKTKCKLECYEGNKLIVDESGDFTNGGEAPAGVLNSLSLGIAFDEATYNSVVPASYRETYDYAASKDALPWLVALLSRTEEKETLEVRLKADDVDLTFNNVPENVGTVSEDKKVLTTKVKNYLMFDIVKDLNILYPKDVTWFKMEITYCGYVYTAAIFVTPNTI